MKRLALIALLIATPTLAQDTAPETVEARGGGLSGLWQISVPSSFGINIGQKASFGAMKNLFCRIDQTDDDLESHCLNGGYAKSGSGTVNGAQVHLAWGSMLARFAIDAVRNGPEMRGTFAFRLAGIRHVALEVSIGTRVHARVQDGSPDAALVRQVLEQAARGPVSVPHDAAAIAENEGGWPKLLAAKGNIVLVAHMGTAPKMDRPEAGDFFTVFDVLFDKGELLCGFHQRQDGILDAFQCV